jgi:hypothetical protein
MNDDRVLVGFEGSRDLDSSFAPLVASVVSSVLASGRGVATGCARGADAFVRSSCPSALVFSVSSGRFGYGRPAFARRSVSLVKAVAGSGPGAGFVILADSPCPAGLVPSSSPARGFRGLGSGSWASAAYAVGLGLPLVVFLCAPSASLPSWPGGSWVVAGSGCWASGWRWVPCKLL